MNGVSEMFEGRRAARMLPFALMLVLGAVAHVVPLHVQPQTVFYAEWLAALGVALGFVCLAARAEVMYLPRVPALAFVLLAIAAVVSAAATRAANPDGLGASGYVLYSALALVCLLIGRQGLAQLGRAQMAAALAWGLLAGALLQSACGALQALELDLGGWVMAKQFALLYGNVAQANHFADLLWLGLAALAYLRGSGRIGRVGFVALAAWLALISAASASRGVWLYTLAFALLPLILRLWRDAGRLPVARALLAVAVVSVAAQLLWTYSSIASLIGGRSAASRLADAQSNGQRMHDWVIAYDAMQRSPWFGEGPASFYRLSVDAAIQGPAQPFPMLAENAHNTVLHLAAELGLPLVLALLLIVALWLRRTLAAGPNAETVFGFAGMAVIGLHSQVEYPLWYTYFLIPFTLLWALATPTTAPAIRLPVVVCRSIAALMLVALAWVMSDWALLRKSESLWAQQGRETVALDRDAIRSWSGEISRFSLFASEARNYQLKAWMPDAASAPAMAQHCDMHWKLLPDWTVMIQCAQAYAASAQVPQRDAMLDALCRGFPRHHALLREWIDSLPDLGGLPLTGRACLQ